MCGGSILTQYHVLTAAHCMRAKPEALSVTAGEVYLSRQDETESTHAVEYFKVHPGKVTIKFERPKCKENLNQVSSVSLLLTSPIALAN